MQSFVWQKVQNPFCLGVAAMFNLAEDPPKVCPSMAQWMTHLSLKAKQEDTAQLALSGFKTVALHNKLVRP